jgi:hypothetical protein
MNNSRHGRRRHWTHAGEKQRIPVLLRDGYRCRLALPGCTEIATTVDHIVPVVLGGADVPENLQAACPACNARKGGRSSAAVRDDAVRNRFASSRFAAPFFSDAPRLDAALRNLSPRDATESWTPVDASAVTRGRGRR